MINEEQMEASLASLDKINRKHEKENGHRFGTINETNHQRIKRIRRWKQLKQVYPDRFVQPPSPDRSFIDWKLVLSKEVDGFDIMITSAERVVPSWSDGEILPLEDWPRITQYNGYCRFMRKPVLEGGYGGILTYVPVHGGITYCKHTMGVSTYGFDTAHAGDEENPMVRNLDYVFREAYMMAHSIRIAARFEPAYLRSEDYWIRADVILKFHKAVSKIAGQEFNLQNNFGSMINLLGGRL